MIPSPFTPVSPGFSPRRLILLAGTLVVLVTFTAYHNSLSGPFVFDDVPTIAGNPTIRQLSHSIAPPPDSGLTVSGRPVVNVSLAVNYALGGLHPWGYHALNLVIHTLAALALFGVVRRTLQRLAGQTRFDVAALPLALVIAGLWAVHPLQTAAVTYTVQRSESLMGLFYLLTFYGFIRGIDCQSLIDKRLERLSEGKSHYHLLIDAIRARECGLWFGFAVATCLLGMATKEVMVSAPLLVWLFDRTFVAGSFRAAWRRRWRFYAALASTWLLLAWLMTGTGGRGGTAGFGLGVTWWQYAFTQCGAVAHYLRLAFWPAPLVFDYGGIALAKNFGEVWPQALAVAAFGAATLVALCRRPAVGFLGAWFFAILAPTSSVVPVADTMFEHRMYLPLAAIMVAAVLAIYSVARQRGLLVGAALAVGLGGLTVRRNEVYRSEFALWRDTVAKRPESVRAHYTLGTVLFALGRADEAIGEYEIALQLKPGSAEAHNDLGNALTRLGRAAEAVPHYEAALRLAPRSADAHNNLGNALLQLGRPGEARTHYEKALLVRPDFADAHNNLGNILAQSGEFSAAARHYEAALQARPDLADAQANLGNVLAQTGRLAEAIAHYEAALQLRPDFAVARDNLARVRTMQAAEAARK
jgi:tetratricopeptide (TPR) repeat protein